MHGVTFRNSLIDLNDYANSMETSIIKYIEKNNLLYLQPYTPGDNELFTIQQHSVFTV